MGMGGGEGGGVAGNTVHAQLSPAPQHTAYRGESGSSLNHTFGSVLVSIPHPSSPPPPLISRAGSIVSLTHVP